MKHRSTSYFTLAWSNLRENIKERTVCHSYQMQTQWQKGHEGTTQPWNMKLELLAIMPAATSVRYARIKIMTKEGKTTLKERIRPETREKNQRQGTKRTKLKGKCISSVASARPSPQTQPQKRLERSRLRAMQTKVLIIFFTNVKKTCIKR